MNIDSIQLNWKKSIILTIALIGIISLIAGAILKKSDFNKYSFTCIVTGTACLGVSFLATLIQCCKNQPKQSTQTTTSITTTPAPIVETRESENLSTPNPSTLTTNEYNIEGINDAQSGFHVTLEL